MMLLPLELSMGSYSGGGSKPQGITRLPRMMSGPYAACSNAHDPKMAQPNRDGSATSRLRTQKKRKRPLPNSADEFSRHHRNSQNEASRPFLPTPKAPCLG